MGGTFTDLVIEADDGELEIHKSPTDLEDPVAGILEVFAVAARARGVEREELLAGGSVLVHGTTRAINAILTGATARTAFLTTEGHPDILLLREGGRVEPFNQTREYPEPYVPRALTFAVRERVLATGEVETPLDEDALVETLGELRDAGVEAVGVSLLWSLMNPAHELRVGELISEHLPGVPYTLSHQLNPVIREYRRAISTCIDASLKPTMTSYFEALSERLAAAGFDGRVLIVSSTGGVLDAAAVARAPIHSINSGPAMAPVAGRHFAAADVAIDTAVIADTGGTSYDVSLVRGGRIPRTRELWLGQPHLSDLTGFGSVDVRSIGAGGGSIAWVDAAGLLHVGPQSAGAKPGPACYGRGGTHATLTDACLVLGYLNPATFLKGQMTLDVDAAREVVGRDVGEPLGMDLDEAAEAVVRLTTEHMVRAIEEITLDQGIDPRTAVLIGGGGAAGLNIAPIARQLGCPKAIVPEVSSTLSAAGSLMSELTAGFAETLLTSTAEFDAAGVNAVLGRLIERSQEFIDGPGEGAKETTIELVAEARYPHQVWELDVPLTTTAFDSDADVDRLREDFDRVHKEVFAINDPGSPVEVVAWRAEASCRLREHDAVRLSGSGGTNGAGPDKREAYFRGLGRVEVDVHQFETMALETGCEGPAIVEFPLSTVVLEPGARAERRESGSLVIEPASGAAEV